MNNSQFDIAGIINFIINIPLLFLAYFHFGKPLFWGTFFGIATQTIFFSIIKIPVTPIVDEYFVACLMGGILSGVGVGITLKSGGTGGGIDILGLYFTQKFKGFSVGKFALLFNAVVYGVCALLFTLPTAIYSIIFTAIYSLAVDKSYPQNINGNILERNRRIHRYRHIHYYNGHFKIWIYKIKTSPWARRSRCVCLSKSTRTNNGKLFTSSINENKNRNYTKV